ncbi:hypothetical protein IFM89_013746 [Coptis chinensis]|uniref:Uncharacterized protein n=1 Tax=Coptis chinensis TaxID=261450 RepID=A0A835HUM5_9MAGN|nr:hypothetical protein IFM89_013746 [Coptis chinensis]
MYELEKKLSCVQEDRGNERAIEAESKAQLLKQALARVEAEKEASLLQYSQCLQKISNLESNVFLAEENARKFYERAVGAETEVQFLKESISQLHEEKEAASLQYQLSLERISNLQSELSHAQEEARRLSNVIVMGYAKLNSTEEQYLQLEKENRSLQEEIDALVEMMETQKQELSEKHEELDRLQLCIQEEAWRVNDENKILKEQNLSSASSIKNLQDEILRLSGAEMKLGKEVEVLVDQRDALQQEIYGLKEEMNNLKKQHLCVMEQMELVGLKPDSFMTSVKSLQEENSSLRETCQKDNDEKVSLLEKLNNFENLYKRNALLESCLSDANARLELLREKVKALEETCQYLRGETFTLVDEKEALISQLEVTNGNIEKLSEKNTLLETFLFDAHVERVWLRGKSKCLEDFCLSLDSEKSDLLAANEFLVSQSKGIQKKMGDLEERYTDLEEKHLGLKKELESRIHQVEDVQVTLVLEKEEHANFILSSGTQLAHLKGNINALQEEGMRRMKDFEEEENKTVKAQLEMFILQRCIQDMEEKFWALFIEYQQHLETSVLSENRVVNLGRENFEQQVKVNSLVDQVGCLRLAICQIALSLEFNPDYECQGKIEQDQILLQLAMGKIKDLKESVWTIEDEKYQLLFENSILLTLFDQLRLEEASIESERSILDTDLRLRTEELLLLQSEKNVLRNASDELNHQIGIGKDLLNQKEVKLSEAEQRLQAIEGENNELNIKLSDLNRECNETRVLKEVLEKKILNISVDNTRKDKEIECLHETTEKLELEVAKLHESIEEQRVKTDDLRSELQKQINAVELWESEAEIMYDNCQITTIHAALFKEKVYELAGACERLQNERDSKTKNVEQLIERLVALECENKGLNCNLAGYSHIMVSLRDSVTSLEDCVFRQTKDYAADNQEPEVADLASHQCDSSYKELTENQGLEGGHEVSDMLELQYRIKNIECSMVEQKRLMLQENTDKDIRLEAAMKEIQKLEQFGNESSNLRLCNTEPDFSEVGDGILVKDIPLDKVSHCSSYDHGFGPRALSRREDSVTNELIVESWETVEQGFDLDFAFNQQRKLSAVHTEEKSDCYQMEALEDKSECPSSEIQSEEVGIVSEGVMVHQGDKRKVLERLASDKQKLLNLQVTVEDLKKKVEQFERCRIPKDTEYSTVKEHLKEVEAAISQLIGTNGKLAKKAGGHSVTSNRKVAEDLEETGKGRRCRISEQARRVSEKIGRLQLEVQRIQFSLLRLEGAKGTKAADRKVLLKDYLYGIQKSRPIDKRKKRLFFSCVKPPST